MNKKRNLIKFYTLSILGIMACVPLSLSVFIMFISNFYEGASPSFLEILARSIEWSMPILIFLLAVLAIGLLIISRKKQ